jgi:hypothetical protein
MRSGVGHEGGEFSHARVARRLVNELWRPRERNPVAVQRPSLGFGASMRTPQLRSSYPADALDPRINAELVEDVLHVARDGPVLISFGARREREHLREVRDARDEASGR